MRWSIILLGALAGLHVEGIKSDADCESDNDDPTAAFAGWLEEHPRVQSFVATWYPEFHNGAHSWVSDPHTCKWASLFLTLPGAVSEASEVVLSVPNVMLNITLDIYDAVELPGASHSYEIVRRTCAAVIGSIANYNASNIARDHMPKAVLELGDYVPHFVLAISASTPSFEMPNMTVPALGDLIPTIKLPVLGIFNPNMPHFVPALGDFTPTFEMPKMRMPARADLIRNVKLPTLPKASLPSIGDYVPSINFPPLSNILPSFELPALGKLMPNFYMQSMSDNAPDKSQLVTYFSGVHKSGTSNLTGNREDDAVGILSAKVHSLEASLVQSAAKIEAQKKKLERLQKIIILNEAKLSKVAEALLMQAT